MKNSLMFLLILLGFCTSESLASLKLTCPNGGEKFVMGSDTLITWEGIAITNSVTLQYSIDNGVNWKLITDKATSLQYIWKNIPNTPSNKCLVKINKNQKSNSYNLEPDIEWQKTYGGSGRDAAKCVHVTSDGGFIVAGSTNSSDGDVTENKGGRDCWIIKLDKSGNIEWQKTYGSSNNEYASSIQQTTDGGYIVAGDIYGQDCSSSAFVLKLDKAGNIEWEKNYKKGIEDHARSIQQTAEGGYIVAGSTIQDTYTSFAWILKLDTFGNNEWENCVTYEALNDAYSIEQTKDGGYIFAGVTEIYLSSRKYLVTKINKFGITMWKNIYGTDDFKFNFAMSITQTNEGGYIIAGLSDIKNRSNDYLVIKIDSSGKIEWEKQYGGSGDDEAESIQQTSDGGYIVCGISSSKDGDITKNNGDCDSWILKLNNSGDIKWQKNLGGSKMDITNSIQQTLDDGYIIAGESTSTDIPGCENKGNTDVYIIKLGYNLEPDISDAVFSIVPPEVNVSIKNDSAYAGQVKRLKLVMNNVNPEIISALAQNFSAKIRFQKTILTPLKKAERILVNDSIYMNIKGTIGTSLELAQILVIAGLGTVEKTTLDIVDFKFTDNSGNNVDFNIKTQPGTFKLLGICEEGGTRLINPTGKVAIMQINPNPASDDIEININLIEEGATTLSVYNLNGVKMKEFNLIGNTGLHTFNLDIQDYTNGLYFIQLQTPTVLTNQKLMIIK